VKLYHYYRSTASYRVRIALNYKKIACKLIPVHLLNDGGEQHYPDYLKINPQALVPTLSDKGHLISQSLAIIEYLEEAYPNPSLLPKDPWLKAEVRSLAMIVACDMHPLNNLRVLQQIRQEFKANEQQVQEWYHHWLALGFDAIEKKLSTIKRESPVCLGNTVTLADLCLIPQVYNAKRFNFCLKPYPLINEINDYCLTLEPFVQAEPNNGE